MHIAVTGGYGHVQEFAQNDLLLDKQNTGHKQYTFHTG